MPEYLVRVTYAYPVSALNAEDALTTVPAVIKGRFIGFHGEGKAEILDGEGKVVLAAELMQKGR